MTDAQAWKEQAAIERVQRDRLASGIILLGLDEPSMPMVLIAERFGVTRAAAQKILTIAGVAREPEFFADSYNGVRRMDE